MPLRDFIECMIYDSMSPLGGQASPMNAGAPTLSAIPDKKRQQSPEEIMSNFLSIKQSADAKARQEAYG